MGQRWWTRHEGFVTVRNELELRLRSRPSAAGGDAASDQAVAKGLSPFLAEQWGAPLRTDLEQDDLQNIFLLKRPSSACQGICNAGKVGAC